MNVQSSSNRRIVRRLSQHLVAGLVVFWLGILVPGGCGVPTELAVPSGIQPPRNLEQAVSYLETGSPEQRIAAASAIPGFGAEAVEAVPQLEANLYYESSHDVRWSAARALGEIGPPASGAAPSLVDAFGRDPSVSVQVAAADALGRIGYARAVPDLAEHLDDVSVELQIATALAISRIAGLDLQDSESSGIYRLDESGEPLIVGEAISWWQTTGQFQVRR